MGLYSHCTWDLELGSFADARANANANAGCGGYKVFAAADLDHTRHVEPADVCCYSSCRRRLPLAKYQNGRT